MSIPSKYEADREIVVQALALFEKKTPAEMAELEKVDPLVRARHSLSRLMATSLLADVVEVAKREAELERIRGQVAEIERVCDKRLAELAESNADLSNQIVELTAEAERQRELAAAKSTPAEKALRSRELELESAWRAGYTRETTEAPLPYPEGSEEERWFNRGAEGRRTERLASAHESDMKSLAKILRTRDGATGLGEIVLKIEELRSAKPVRTRHDVIPSPPFGHGPLVDGDDEQWEAQAVVSVDFDALPSPPARLEVREGYRALAKILDLALHQAQSGKGRERHGQQAEWTEQKIFQIPLLQGHAGGLVYQIAKKATESEHMDDAEAQFREALGVVVYAAALAHYYREGMKQESE